LSKDTSLLKFSPRCDQ